MSNYGYGGRGNPYDQREGGAPGGGYGAPQRGYNAPQQVAYNTPQGGGYNQQPYGAAPPAYGGSSRYNGAQPAMGRDNYAGQNVEMEPLAANGSSFGQQQDPNSILNKCRDIDRGIDSIERNLEKLQLLQQRVLSDPDSSEQSATNRQLDSLSSDTMAMYRELAARIKDIKGQPDSGSPRNAPQVGKVDRKLKTAINQYQNVENTFRHKLQEQIRRQYQIVRPDATEAEVDAAVADTSNRQVFMQTLKQSSRSKQANEAFNAVQNRHQALQKIESQMIELAQLFQDMEALVVQQESAVEVIEQKGEEVVTNMDNGNQQLETGIKSARARNRKKWWCLLICVIIIIIVVVVVVIYLKVINPPKSAKRSIIDALQAPYAAVSQNIGSTLRPRHALTHTPWKAASSE